MARIRTVKPELFRHEGLFELEQSTGLPIRLSFAGLFTCCDREGRFKWQPRVLKLDVLPHDQVDFAAILDALEQSGYVIKYQCDAEVYGCIPTFLKHQVINNREKASDIPAFDDDRSQVIESESQLTRQPRVHHASATRLSNAQGEGKGKEGNKEGKGREGEYSQASPSMVDVVFDYWKQVMGKGPTAKMTPKREKAIKAILKLGYTVEQIKQAVDGCKASPFHQGQNDRMTVYDDIELICRSGEKLESFISCVGAGAGVETIDQFRLRVDSQAARVAAMIGGDL